MNDKNHITPEIQTFLEQNLPKNWYQLYIDKREQYKVKPLSYSHMANIKKGRFLNNDHLVDLIEIAKDNIKKQKQIDTKIIQTVAERGVAIKRTYIEKFDTEFVIHTGEEEYTLKYDQNQIDEYIKLYHQENIVQEKDPDDGLPTNHIPQDELKDIETQFVIDHKSKWVKNHG